MYFLQSAFKNQLEKVRLSLGCELGPSQDQKGVLAVCFLNQQFVAKMQGTGAEETREGREGYLLSRLCQWVLISFMFASLSGASEKENLQYNHKVNTIANVTVKKLAQYFGLKKLIQEVKSNKGNLKGKRPYINSSFKYNCIKMVKIRRSLSIYFYHWGPTGCKGLLVVPDSF